MYKHLERGSSTSAFLTIVVGVRDDEVERKMNRCTYMVKIEVALGTSTSMKLNCFVSRMSAVASKEDGGDMRQDMVTASEQRTKRRGPTWSCRIVPRNKKQDCLAPTSHTSD